ncbi:MAG TPA: enoyl-CoA hydratase/isomerase family protein [Caulobacteraceae bacterium]|jgi:enoyl-CoA hydratase
MSDESEVIVSRVGGLGRLTLNRPQALGALTTGMCVAMTDALLDWRDDPDLITVLIDHAGERGFCGGGDIRMLAESAAGDGKAAMTFFHTEYRLNHLLGDYPKPIVTVMDGITMGGGVGIALPSRYRIATERTRLAMPETGIGLFPDVGAGWFLPKLPGRIGLWMVLTGARLQASDCKYTGLATEVVSSKDLPGLKAALAKEPDEVERIVQERHADLGPPPLIAQQGTIDRLFDGDSVEAVVAALEADGSAWAKEQLEILRPKSPLSSKVSFRLIAGGLAPATLADDLVTEYRLAAHVAMQPDFREGVRAVIVDKDNAPVWNPATLAETSDALIDEMFAALPAGEEWSPLPTA